jgi:hypothetical protein
MRHCAITNSKRPSRLMAVMVLLALGAALTACDRPPQLAPDAKLSAAPHPAASPPPVPAVAQGANSAETSNANNQPMKSMTKEEESTSMPQPGQANDHSTLAKDSKK